jgi:hypothetical protein
MVGSMASIEVDPLGLSALAGHCEEQAARLGSMATPSFSGGGFQPSAAAVQAAHADVAAAGARLMARMQSTAAAASTAAVGYVSTETSSTADIAAVAQPGTTAV